MNVKKEVKKIMEEIKANATVIHADDSRIIYICPSCGKVEDYVSVFIEPYVGTYCQKCYAKWISETFPRLKKKGD